MKSQPIKLKLTYKLDKKELDVPSSKTFGDLKVLIYFESNVVIADSSDSYILTIEALLQTAAAKQFNLPAEGIALLYRGRKKADNEVLALAGVKNGMIPFQLASALRA